MTPPRSTWIDAKAEELQQARVGWVAAALEPVLHLVARFYGPLVSFFLSHFGSSEWKSLPQRLQGGAAVVGVKPAKMAVEEFEAWRGDHIQLVLCQVWRLRQFCGTFCASRRPEGYIYIYIYI